MNKRIATALLATLIPFAAGAASARTIDTPVSRQLYTCAGGGLSRVSTAARPAPCCDGMLGCPQLLGNTGFVRPTRDNRT